MHIHTFIYALSVIESLHERATHMRNLHVYISAVSVFQHRGVFSVNLQADFDCGLDAAMRLRVQVNFKRTLSHVW